MGKFFIFVFKSIVIIFSVVGFGLVSAYLAVCFHWTNTKGVVDQQADIFWKDGKTAVAAISLPAENNALEDDIF